MGIWLTNENQQKASMEKELWEDKTDRNTMRDWVVCKTGRESNITGALVKPTLGK